jgi:hypothetical protein
MMQRSPHQSADLHKQEQRVGIARTAVVRAADVRAFGLRGVDGEYTGESGEAGFEVAS